MVICRRRNAVLWRSRYICVQDVPVISRTIHQVFSVWTPAATRPHQVIGFFLRIPTFADYGVRALQRGRFVRCEGGQSRLVDVDIVINNYQIIMTPSAKFTFFSFRRRVVAGAKGSCDTRWVLLNVSSNVLPRNIVPDGFVDLCLRA